MNGIAYLPKSHPTYSIVYTNHDCKFVFVLMFGKVNSHSLSPAFGWGLGNRCRYRFRNGYGGAAAAGGKGNSHSTG